MSMSIVFKDNGGRRFAKLFSFSYMVSATVLLSSNTRHIFRIWYLGEPPADFFLDLLSNRVFSTKALYEPRRCHNDGDI